MDELSQCIFILLMFLNKHNIGVSIARTILGFDCLSGCKNSLILLLPILLL
jgi:hypothetical protein